MAMSRPVNVDDMLRGLECPVCHEYYRDPKILPCGHSLCLSPCLEQIADGKERIRCPECRMEHVIPEGRIDNFPTNVPLVRLLETPKPTDCFTGCPVCGDVEELAKCHHCNLHICELCRENHAIKFKDNIIELLVKLKEDTNTEDMSMLTEKRNQFESSVKESVEDGIQKVKKFGEKAHAIIDDRMDELLQSIKEYQHDQTKHIDDCEEEIKNSLQDVHIYCENAIADVKRRRVPNQSKMAELLSTIKSKQRFVKDAIDNFGRLTQNIHIDRDTQPLEQAVAGLGNIVLESLTKDNPEEDGSSKGGKSNDANDCNKAVDHKNTESILTRDISVKLCIGSEGTGERNLTNPWGVAVNPVNKDITIVDRGNHRIQVFDKEGQPKFRFGTQGNGQKQLNYPTGVACSSEGEIVIADNSNHRILIYSIEGNFVRLFGTNGSGQGQFSNPWGVAVDPDEFIHVCDYSNKRVQVFSKTGQYSYMYSTWRKVYDDYPRFISINGNRNIAISLSTRIVVLNKETQLMYSFEVDKATFYGIGWVDNEHLIVNDYNKHILQIYKLNGELQREFGEPGYHVGQLQNPVGLAVDDEGFVYVSSQYSNMVQKF